MRVLLRSSVKNYVLLVGVILTLEAVGLAQQATGSGSQVRPVLLQIAHLSGDQYSGFRESCLLVHEDGRFHRELRQQENRENRPTGKWSPADVFEGKLSSSDFQSLHRLVEAPEFQATNGTVGDPDLSGRLVFDLPSVIPAGMINIVAVSAVRLNDSQAFEIFLPTPHLQDLLKTFVEWVDAWEKQKLKPTTAAEINDCAISPSGGRGRSWIPQTSLPKLISQTAPPRSNEQQLRAESKVHIRAVVNVDGSVAPLSVIRGINPVIDQEALETVKNWRFEPGRLVGLPIATRMDVEVKVHSP